MTLLVASRSSGLAFIDAEIETVVNNLDADLCIVTDDFQRVADAISRKPYKTIWFAGHGDDNGIWLSKDCHIDANTLAPVIRDRGVELIILNSCNSERMAFELYANTDAAIVYTEAAVQDAAAFSTARRFAAERASGKDVATAFKHSRSKHFRLVPERIITMADSALDDVRAALAEIQKSLLDIDHRLLVLEIRNDLANSNTKTDRTHWIIIAIGLLLAGILFLALSGNELLGPVSNISVPNVGITLPRVDGDILR
jgi:hypothetical protein